MTEWQPPHERDFAVAKERPPLLRWLVGVVVLLAVAIGAIWLASQVVTPGQLPVAERPVAVPEAPPPKSADDEAWVRALEIDTLEGYRDYLAAFPEGRHVEAAQAEIDAYDDRAWATAQERDTVAGYEDYLEAWPEGKYASQARERIAEMKAAAEAAREDAAKRAAQERADWQRAAETNTVPAYQGYLSKHPAGPNAAEAQARIDRLQASAADEAAWAAARAANQVPAYQQYLTSFPQGAHAAEAIAAIEALRPSPGRTFRDCQQCPEMVTVPAGTATLGSSGPDARPNEGPARPVTFAQPFAIGTREVTFAEWEACVAGGGCQPKSDKGWGRGDRPVINVSWTDAQGYASWLSSKTGKSYALPSEAQWEYAARAGTSGAYIGGSLKALCAFANGASAESGLAWANTECTDPAADRTLPTGRLSANGHKLRDTIGNVAEWTQDCNTLNLRDAPTDGSPDARGSCAQRVVRGGSWFSGPADLRFGARLMQRRGDSNDFTGFRVVRN